MSEYQTSSRGLPVFFLLLLIILPAVSWYGYTHLSERVFDALRKNAGLDIRSNSVSLDLFGRQLILQEVALNHQGIQLHAATIDIGIKYSSWLDLLWLQRGLAMGDVGIHGAQIELSPGIKLSPGKVTPLKLKAQQVITIDKGELTIDGLEEPVSFSEIILYPVPEQGFNAKARGVGESPWLFDGQLVSGSDFLVGQLELSRQSLSFFLPGAVGWYDASLSVEFSQERGIGFEGSVEGGEGYYEQNGSILSWKHWQLEDFSLFPEETVRPSVELTMAGVDLMLSEVDVEEPYQFPVQILHQFPVQPTVIHASDGVFRTQEDSWLLRNLFLYTEGEIEGLLRYRLNAELQSGGQVSFLGELEEENELVAHQYQLQLNDVLLTDEWRSYTAVGGYDLNGSKASLTYDSSKQKGELALQDWQYSILTEPRLTEPRTVSMPALQSLLTDQQGVATTAFTLSTSVIAELLSEQIRDAVLLRWQEVTGKPLDYLSSLMSDGFSTQLIYYSGGSSLTPESIENLLVVKKLLSIRPGLQLDIAVAVSEKEDWEILAGHELNKSLSQLYRALYPTGARKMSDDLRGQLVEQVYLNTQKRKIPEVGELSVRKRQQFAEQWLLKHWPKNPLLLKELQRQRIQVLRRQLRSMGFIDRQYQIKADTDGEAVSLIKIH